MRFFEKKDTNVESITLDKTTKLRYQHPKVMLVDLPASAYADLSTEGFNIVKGTLGNPYKVKMGDGYLPIISNAHLPYYDEQEIVVIDLAPPEVLDNPTSEQKKSLGTDALWASCSTGIIDPRLPKFSSIRESSDRILKHGGIFIVFAVAPREETLRFTHSVEYMGLAPGHEFLYSNYEFLEVLSSNNFKVKYALGNEFEFNKEIFDTTLVQLLTTFLDGAEYQCTFHTFYDLRNRWLTLAKNKYEAPVSGIIMPSGNEGTIFLFPQIENKADFLKRLFVEVLPAFAPKYFPEVARSTWLKSPEYEHPSILKLNAEIHTIHETARQQIAEREAVIESEREKYQHLHDLLTTNDKQLEDAVKKAFAIFGFQQIIDVDEAIASSGNAGMRREDLQIHDISPTLLVEIKGVTGYPTESDSLQVSKNISARMKEWNRTDVRGLTIINHQRNLPALERQNKEPFQPDVLTAGEEQDIGFMTTWDLFRLLRSFEQNPWKHADVQSLFYQSGRIEIVPAHYEYIGVIKRFYPNASVVVIELQEGQLRFQDRVAYELPVAFKEEEVISMRDEDNSVVKISVGSFASISTSLSQEQARKGIRVFRIKREL